MVTLGLGSAALITAFGIAHAALFRQPPFPDADRLTLLYLERNPRNEPHRRERWSFGRIQLLEGAQRSFDAVASYSPAALTVSAEGQGDAELVRGEMVSPAYFGLLGADPEQGRLLVDTENVPGAPSPVAVIGIFAVLAYAVATKTREFGIRIALGANPARVIGQVLREGMAFPTAGLLAGIVASGAMTRVLRSSLYEISPLEPVVFFGTATVLLGVSLLACLGPAWRATRANPIEALRAE